MLTNGRFFLLVIIFGCCSVSAGVEKRVKDIVTKYKIPSLSVMVLSKDEVIVHEFSGVKKMGEDDKVNETSSFHLGSCGKAFTASLIFKLYDEGKINLDDSITKYIKKLDLKKFEDVKIKHLLSHTAGIVANVEGKSWEGMFSFDITPSEGRDIAINYLNKSKRVGKSGTVFEYSNIGYMLLGQVIEKVESKSFEDVITEKLFKPFKMKSCSFGAAGKNGSSDQPWAHRLENSRFIPQNPKLISSDNPPAMIPAGGISCSQKDWSTFIKFVMGVGINHDYLSEKARKLMLKTNLNNYTYGAWGKVTKDWSGELLAHAGSNNLNYSYAIVGLDKKFAFLLNSNSPAEQAIFELIPFLKDYYLNSLK